jgi:hypothetical protein
MRREILRAEGHFLWHLRASIPTPAYHKRWRSTREFRPLTRPTVSATGESFAIGLFNVAPRSY